MADDKATEKKPKLNPIVVALIAGNMQAVGITLKNLDLDNVGRDDVVGGFLIGGADAFQGYVNSNDKQLDKGLLVAYKVIGSYLKERGKLPTDG